MVLSICFFTHASYSSSSISTFISSDSSISLIDVEDLGHISFQLIYLITQLTPKPYSN